MRRGAPRKEVCLSKENITPGKALNITFVRRHSELRILSPKPIMDLLGIVKKGQHKFCAAFFLMEPLLSGSFFDIGMFTDCLYTFARRYDKIANR